MAEIDVAISLIQLIALFLPAWAVMVQILTRAISNDYLTSHPRAIPFVAGAFAAAIMSLFQFAWATVQLIDFLRGGGFLGRSVRLAHATELIAFGSATFLVLGGFVIAQAALETYDDDDATHIIVVTLLFILASAFAWVGGRWESIPLAARPGRLAVALSAVWLLDMIYIYKTDPRVGDTDDSEIGIKAKLDESSSR